MCTQHMTSSAEDIAQAILSSNHTKDLFLVHAASSWHAPSQAGPSHPGPRQYHEQLAYIILTGQFLVKS